MALAAGLVPLLFQLRRTAMGIDQFLISSRKDLAQIAEDVHASRIQMNQLAGSLQSSLDEVAAFARLMGEVAGTVKHFQTRFHGTFDSAAQNLGTILGGLSSVLAFFKNRKS